MVIFIVLLILGITSSFNNPNRIVEKTMIKSRTHMKIIISIMIGVMCGILAWYTTREIGWFSIIIAILSSALISVLSFSSSTEDIKFESKS